MFPTKSVAFKKEKSVPGFKRSKERETILPSSNGTGDHKLNLCFIGTAKKLVHN